MKRFFKTVVEEVAAIPEKYRASRAQQHNQDQAQYFAKFIITALAFNAIDKHRKMLQKLQHLQLKSSMEEQKGSEATLTLLKESLGAKEIHLDNDCLMRLQTLAPEQILLDIAALGDLNEYAGHNWFKFSESVSFRQILHYSDLLLPHLKDALNTVIDFQSMDFEDGSGHTHLGVGAIIGVLSLACEKQDCRYIPQADQGSLFQDLPMLSGKFMGISFSYDINARSDSSHNPTLPTNVLFPCEVFRDIKTLQYYIVAAIAPFTTVPLYSELLTERGKEIQEELSSLDPRQSIPQGADVRTLFGRQRIVQHAPTQSVQSADTGQVSKIPIIPAPILQIIAEYYSWAAEPQPVTIHRSP